LCFIASSFLDHGGVEEWLMQFKELVNTNNWETMFYFWSTVKIEKFHQKFPEAILTRDVTSMIKFCDIIIATAYWKPPMDYKGKYFYINHGSSASKWSMDFLKLNLGEEVISVSSDIGIVTPKTILYTPIKNQKCERTIRKDCELQFLVVGRNSPEKRIGLACSVVNEIADSCLFIISDSIPEECLNNRIKFLGADERMCSVTTDFLLVPSESEGGPLVAVEAWSNGIPVVMSDTGFVKDFPNSFLIYNWTNPLELKELVNNKGLVNTVLADQHNSLMKFDKHAFQEFWQRRLVSSNNEMDIYIKDHINVSPIMIGNTLILTCVGFCKFTIVTEGINKVEIQVSGTCQYINTDLRWKNYIKSTCSNAVLYLTF